MKKILVTGGAGFIGSHLTKKLVEEGNEVIVYDLLLRGNKLNKDILNSVIMACEDIRNAEALFKYSKGCDIIIHFAALLGVDIVADKPVETMETEILGMKNVTDACMFHDIEKLVYASTSGVYGHSAIEKSVTENIQLDPRTSYSIAKRYNEIYLAALFEEKGLQSVSLRFFNVYGVKQDNRMVIPRFFEQAINNKPITVFGTGKQTRDFTSVEDTVFATVQLAKKIHGCNIFNVANENEVTIIELANLIKDITNSSSEIINVGSPQKRYDFEVERRVGSSEKLFKSIGFKPKSSLRDGLIKIFHEEYKKLED